MALWLPVPVLVRGQSEVVALRDAAAHIAAGERPQVLNRLRTRTR
jgi:hypothetical protein